MKFGFIRLSSVEMGRAETKALLANGEGLALPSLNCFAVSAPLWMNWL